MATVKQNRERVSRDIALRRALLNRDKKTNVKRIPKWQFPHKVELLYRKQLLNIVDLIDKMMNEILIPKLPVFQRELAADRPELKNDAFIDDLNATINNMQTAINTNESDPTVVASTIGGDISQFNHGQLTKIMHSAFGVNVFSSEPWLTTQLGLFTQQNVDLIKSLSVQSLDAIKGIVTRGLAAGVNLTDMKKDLEKRIGITSRRAKTIARDQTSKLNGQLTQLRQTQNGISKYVWVTAGDERVRPTHAANEGQTFSWDEPPATTGHPGDDINCRCIASPVLNELV